MNKRNATKRAKKLLQKTNWNVYECKDGIWDLIAFRKGIGLIIKIMTEEPKESEKEKLRTCIPQLDNFSVEIWIFRVGEQAPVILSL